MIGIVTSAATATSLEVWYNVSAMTLDELIAQLDGEDLEQARQMTPSEKLRAGGDLFDDACRWTLAGICHQHPEFSPEQAMDELRRRIDQAEEAAGRPS
jgi:hypothetical protein